MGYSSIGLKAFLTCMTVMICFSEDSQSKKTQKAFDFHLEQRKDKKWELILQNAPMNCFALAMAPAKLEEKLKTGKWLVLGYAIYSPDDVKTVKDTVAATREFERSISVGIRPFVSNEENTTWFPGYEQTRSSFWIFFEDGKLISSKYSTDFHEHDKWSLMKFKDWVKMCLHR